MREKRQGSVLRIVCALSAGLCLTSATAAVAGIVPATATSAKATHSLIVGAPDVPITLDFQSSVLNTNSVSSWALNDRLIDWGKTPNPASLGGGTTIDANPSHVKPMLATKWSFSSSGDALTFELRHGVKSVWGNELTANDVKWTFDRGMALQNFTGRSLRLTVQLASVTVLSKYAVRLNFLGQSPAAIPYLAFIHTMSIFDSTEAQQHATASDPWATAWLSANPDGFGPYTVTSWTKGQQMVLTARSDYYGQKPYFTKVTVLAIPDAGSRLSALTGGSIDVAMGLSPQALQTVQRNKNLKVISIHGNNTLILFPNFTFGPFKDIRVRQAIAKALPYDAIIKAVYFGQAEIAKSMFPPYFPFWTGKYWHYNTNVAAAKKLMAQAGYANGFDVTLDYAAEATELDPVAGAIQAALGQIGIRVTLEKQPQSVLVSRALGPHDIPLYLSDTGSVTVPDPGAMTAFFTQGYVANVTNYINPQFLQIHTAGLSSLTKATRKGYYVLAQAIFERDLPQIFIAYFPEQWAMKKSIQGYTWDPGHGLIVRTLTGS